jgi:hypothetical protein
LNIFYNSKIKLYEKKIFVFDCTVLYAMYMLSTTNFKEYAEIIIKNTAKLLEEVYVFENDASETFAIRAFARDELKSFIYLPGNKLQPICTTDRKGNEETQRFKLIIDTVSTGLCKILHLSKGELINQELKTIIPNGYKEPHTTRLSSLLDFETPSTK